MMGSMSNNFMHFPEVFANLLNLGIGIGIIVVSLMLVGWMDK
jgi:hypothetical protein